MKRFLVLVTVMVFGICLMAGCASEVKTYTLSGEVISVGVNQEFMIALDSNPTTGYSWQESHDETMLKLVEKTYKPGDQAKQGLVGAGGIEYFQFKALKTGETKVTMNYNRPWETEVLEQKVFTVNIK